MSLISAGSSTALAMAPEQLVLIDLLERLAPARAPPDVANEQEERDRRLLGVVHADRGVRRARPSADEDGRRPAGEARERIGRERRPALVARAHHAEAVLAPPERVEHCEEALAGHREARVDAGRQQRLSDRIAGQPHLGGTGGPRVFA